MRGVKAEGGWAVVSTEEVEIHPSGEITPYIEGRIWDESDLPALELMVEKVQQHGSLAAIELCHNGMDAPNLWSREVPMGPAAGRIATFAYHPLQARAMDKSDIADMRHWHRQAALRSRQIGFDLIYVYAAHALSFLHHFLSRQFNHRTDEYGGSLENRVRLFREIIEDTKDAVGHDCAVPVRLSMDQLLGPDGLERAEVEDMIAMLAELPDLWDVCIAEWHNDSMTARFGEEGYQEPYTANVKKLTTKPVVGVGRYTSPDRMASLIRKGHLDFIGAARPSIADPFLPNKIEAGRLEDIRECIGCNICVSGDFTMAPIRCTQNPTMGEEWRKGWHPEKLKPAESREPVLIIGAGPAGLECAQALGKRGYPVTLADAGSELGGRLIGEARLPGLASWIRVRDYRAQQLDKLGHVDVYLNSRMNAEQIEELGINRIVLATGSAWRRDGVGHFWRSPMPDDHSVPVMTPDDIIKGERPKAGPVMIFDDDHYYMAGVIAELLAGEGLEVIYLTPAADVSTWTHNTMEQERIQARLIEHGVQIVPHKNLAGLKDGEALLSCVFTNKGTRIAVGSAILVTARDGVDELSQRISQTREVSVIGDALAPATIAHAVYAGRRYAEELDSQPLFDNGLPFRREVTALLKS